MDDRDQSDHDLLVEIHTTVTRQIGPTLRDHETRIRKAERVVWIATGVAATIGSLVGASAGTLIGA